MPFRPRPNRGFALLAALLALATLSSCSIRKFATRSVANSLTSGPDVYATDDDPELVREAIPFGLKTIESLLATLPDHEGLLLAACRGFTQYAVGFVAADADQLPPDRFEEQEAVRARALRLCLRGRDYGLRALERRHRGIRGRLERDPAVAAAEIGAKELPLLFWTAASWGSAISLGKDRPELMADVSVVKALFARGLALDERWDGGSFHEAMIIMEALPAAMGGSLERARGHFRRARELSNGRASVFVTLAENVSVQTQDRAEFETLLADALAVDPDREPTLRLATLISQRRARTLLGRRDDLFLPPLDDTIAPDTTQTQESP